MRFQPGDIVFSSSDLNQRMTVEMAYGKTKIFVDCVWLDKEQQQHRETFEESLLEFAPWLVELKCDDGHEQRLTLEGFNKAMAKDYVGLLTGKSPTFVHPVAPGRGTPGSVGKCGICGADVNASVKLA